MPEASLPVERGLLVREPWLGMILSGGKVWEMRGRATSVRGRVALIRSGSGTVVGTAVLSGCGAAVSAGRMAETIDLHGIPASRLDEAIRMGWTVPWFLEDAREIQPVAYAHPRGAVTWVRLSPDVRAAIGD